jgi:ribosomal protein S18 acetylase RimI-like enzyme
MASIEPARPEDVAQVGKISESVFEDYGEYGKVVAKFFASQGVTTYVARVGAEVAGFVMLGFLPWSGGAGEGNPWISDLLAIAVVPRHRRRGIGDALMQRMFRLVNEMSEWRDVKEIQLTCAEGNQAGLEFFKKHGFAVIDPRHGSYSGGQPALRMAKRLQGS